MSDLFNAKELLQTKKEELKAEQEKHLQALAEASSVAFEVAYNIVTHAASAQFNASHIKFNQKFLKMLKGAKFREKYEQKKSRRVGETNC